MSTSARPENQQSPSSSDENIVFVASMDTVPVWCEGVVRTRAVLRARGAGPLQSVARGRRGRPILGTWGPPRGVLIGRIVGHPSGGPVGRSSDSGASVINLESSAKRPRSPSPDDEDLFCLGQVVAQTGKFIPRCVP